MTKVIMSNDHAGVSLREVIKQTLDRLGHETVDLGVNTAEHPVDFPDVVQELTDTMAQQPGSRGILLCGTGVGASIAANKVPGIRAALCQDSYSAQQSVEHDNTNVLCLGAWIVGPVIAQEIVSRFLAAEFSTDPAFQRRVHKLAQMDGSATSEER